MCSTLVCINRDVFWLLLFSTLTLGMDILGWFPRGWMFIWRIRQLCILITGNITHVFYFPQSVLTGLAVGGNT